MSESPHCTRCNSTDVVPIIWGMPSAELADEIDKGKVDAILGGCSVEDHTHECRRCGSRFVDGEDWFTPAPNSVFFQIDDVDDITDEQLIALAEQIRSNAERQDP